MRNPIDDEAEIIVKFDSVKQHERFCHETGAGSRFIYRKTDSGRTQVLCRMSRGINRYGEWVDNPLWLTANGKPSKSIKITPLERSLLEMR
jgi:hypothetical protein